ncbi:MAG: phosphoglucomutase [Roseiflexaceae bacterium]
MGHRPQLQYHRWEGIVAADVTLVGMRQRAAALATHVVQRGWTCLVAFDTRFMAGQFALDALRTLEAAGASCLFCPTPVPIAAIERALDQRRADCALIMTAGSRPFWYSGLLALTPPIDQDLFHGDLPLADQVRPFPPTSDTTESPTIDLRSLYIDNLRTSVDVELIRRSTQTIFVDPMSGTASGLIPAVLGDASQTKAIEINRESDPLFARQTPHPLEAGLARLRKLVRESDSHFGVACSADGRAIGVVDTAGELLSPYDLALVIGQHLSRHYRQRGLVILPPSPPGAQEIVGGARAWEDAYGLKLEQREATGVRIAELSERDRASLVVGITPTGEVTLGRMLGVPDALLAALVLLEAVTRSGMKLRPLLLQLRART